MATLESLTKDIADLKRIIFEKLEANNNAVSTKVVNLENTVLSTTNELNASVMYIRNRVVSLLRDENVCLRDRVRTLEDRIIKVERQVNRVEQNGRKNNMEIDGIPHSVRQEDLAKTVVDIVNDVSDVKIDVNDVEAVHRLYSKKEPKPVIVCMKRNVIDSVCENRKKLKDVGSRLNLQGLWYFCKPQLIT